MGQALRSPIGGGDPASEECSNSLPRPAIARSPDLKVATLCSIET